MKTEEVQYAQHNNLSLDRLIIKRSGNPNPKHGNGKLKILAYYFEVSKGASIAFIFIVGLLLLITVCIIFNTSVTTPTFASI